MNIYVKKNHLYIVNSQMDEYRDIDKKLFGVIFDYVALNMEKKTLSIIQRTVYERLIIDKITKVSKMKLQDIIYTAKILIAGTKPVCS